MSASLLNQPLLVLANVPDQAVAERIADALVAQGLAACVNILAPARSVYRWQGKVQRDTELPLLIKTTQARYQELEQAIVQLHPYDVPEIIALPITAGLPAYLAWMQDETARPLRV
ncbi:cation tolerance protein CutA [Herbaspirillum rubrisubalbicans]|uniref:Cation tolerance protein CutA n=2 Tax=Herbaspirillum rubrisubalbicans TaxID=80842 RepID=A0ABX9BUZ4_9BURK|nr:divalent-cation tolerance protein CutA [Herbaspirillum rubrisubalbicans]MCP1575514.1 periplasmic divalent cation tolerance protein [Herbaspirillum rubrisubalbicans]NQE51761.1 cation tolerance protein CutA [Herbaspirillum rubrisubalbicans]QJP98847.1 divalent-cation tolerance protein CutA [Herbaspirillum rubrisubalbicans Os34]RAM61577.1 cation tolerance protein CutA [Herbaspirillum rubrisubalbicans]RAN42959.1 cation tolerance protein CutA [Herbaspirillum rubrisubalbicans]